MLGVHFVCCSLMLDGLLQVLTDMPLDKTLGCHHPCQEIMDLEVQEAFHGFYCSHQPPATRGLCCALLASVVSDLLELG
jgi:hypothetical protein